MINIANTITILRKERGWSQTELAKKVGCSREIISKYEKDNVMPSIEMAKNIADAFEVTLDYLVGEGQNATFDKKMLQRIQLILKMNDNEKSQLLNIVDAVIRDYNAKKAYG